MCSQPLHQHHGLTGMPDHSRDKTIMRRGSSDIVLQSTSITQHFNLSISQVPPDRVLPTPHVCTHHGRRARGGGRLRVDAPRLLWRLRARPGD
eukprot:3544757-Pleurochrysis_carterae.AAC.1